MAHSQSFLANQKARNAIVGAENLLKVNNLLIQTMTSDENLSAFGKAMKTGQTGCYQLIMLYVATTFEECTACHPCEVLQSSVECLQMTWGLSFFSFKPTGLEYGVEGLE